MNDSDTHTWHFLSLHEVHSNDSNFRYYVGTCGNGGAGHWTRFRLERVGGVMQEED